MFTSYADLRFRGFSRQVAKIPDWLYRVFGLKPKNPLFWDFALKCDEVFLMYSTDSYK